MFLVHFTKKIIAKTSTALTAGSTYNSSPVFVAGYRKINLLAKSDKASATNGLKIQQSIDGTNWDYENTWTLAAATGRVESVEVYGDYVRISFTNGGTNQTYFRLLANLR